MMKNEKPLTTKQQKFINLMIHEPNITAADAYRQAGYNCDGKDAQYIARKATGVMDSNNGKIRAIITQKKAEMQRKVENATVWTRKEMLDMLHDVAAKSMAAIDMPKLNDDGEIVGNVHNAAASRSAIMAVEQAAKMCGFNEPEQVDATVTVVLGGAEDYAL